LPVNGGLTVANPEHLEVIDQGVEIWNEWREKNLEIERYLMEAELREARSCECGVYV
jgi:hypothetical protein